MLTARQIAEDLVLSVDTVTGYLQTGKIRGAKVGGYWRVSEKDYEAFKASLYPRPNVEAPAERSDPHLFSPRSARSEAARRGAERRRLSA